MVVWEEKDTKWKWKWKSLSLWLWPWGCCFPRDRHFVRGSSAAGRNRIADAKNMSFFSYQNIKVIVLLIDWY